MLSFALPKYMNEGYMDSNDAIFIAPNTATCSWSSDATVVNAINNLGGTAEYYALESPYDTHGTVVEIYKSSELINWMLSR